MIQVIEISLDMITPLFILKCSCCGRRGDGEGDEN